MSVTLSRGTHSLINNLVLRYPGFVQKANSFKFKKKNGSAKLQMTTRGSREKWISKAFPPSRGRLEFCKHRVCTDLQPFVLMIKVRIRLKKKGLKTSPYVYDHHCGYMLKIQALWQSASMYDRHGIPGCVCVSCDHHFPIPTSKVNEESQTGFLSMAKMFVTHLATASLSNRRSRFRLPS